MRGVEIGSDTFWSALWAGQCLNYNTFPILVLNAGRLHVCHAVMLSYNVYLDFKFRLLSFMFINSFCLFNLQVGLSCSFCNSSCSEFFISFGSYSIWGCWKKSWPSYRFVMPYIECSKNEQKKILKHAACGLMCSSTNMIFEKYLIVYKINLLMNTIIICDHCKDSFSTFFGNRTRIYLS